MDDRVIRQLEYERRRFRLSKQQQLVEINRYTSTQSIVSTILFVGAMLSFAMLNMVSFIIGVMLVFLSLTLERSTNETYEELVGKKFR